MDDYTELKIWLKFAAVVIFIFASSITTCTLRDDQLIANMAEKGADPIKARCAIYGATYAEAAIICFNQTNK